jgi:hypothetical protein
LRIGFIKGRKAVSCPNYQDFIFDDEELAMPINVRRRWAEQGDAEAQYDLGFAYLNGRGMAKDAYNAAHWFQKAADQGHVDAQCHLGAMYEDGYGVPQDDHRAAKWFQKAADQGNALGQFGLGVVYAKLHGKLHNDCKAVKCFQKAAEQGHANAQYRLGRMYADGRGVAQDRVNALKWLQKAADQGHESALDALAGRQAAKPFPPPPVPGNADIQPLTSAAMLREEGQTMRHCVGDGEYAGAVRKGKCYIYKVLRPVRATLEIRPISLEQWEAHQIKGYSNAEVSPDTVQAVRAWLVQYCSQ